MGDQSSNNASSPSSSSTAPPISVGRLLGRVAPSFRRAIPSVNPSSKMKEGESLPSLPHPSTPPSPPPLSETLPPASNHHLMDYSNDTAIAQLDEAHCEMELETRKRKRRSKINSADELLELWERGEGEEGDILPSEGCPIANLCELMVGERSSGVLIRALKEEKREGVAALLEMMIKGGFRPVKISGWAEEAGIDEYYLGTYAREACEQLPPGIVKMKDGNFVMGEALTEYANLFKTIYAHEVTAILDEEETINEKNSTSQRLHERR